MPPRARSTEDTGPSTVDTNEEWTTVREPAGKVILTDIGDVFIGVYEGKQTIVPENGGEEFDQHLFRNDEGLFAISHSFSMKAMTDVPIGRKTRIELVELVKAEKGTMKNYKIQYA